MVKAVVGANWGDEGKGKITDMLGQNSPILSFVFREEQMQVIRSLMTMVNLHLHTLPSGVFYSHTTSMIGNGVALNIPVLI